LSPYLQFEFRQTDIVPVKYRATLAP
jgi:hypothetical protein